MKKIVSRSLLLGFPCAMLLAASFTIMAASVAQMKACEMAVLNKPKFHDLPMAAVSVYPGNKDNHVHFTVRWDGLKADGNCKVDKDDYVEKVNIKQFHDGRQGNSEADNWKNTNDLDGFYYDRHTGKWRDPSGRTCHTCTPDNGFPDHSRHYHDNYKPKNKYERQMQKQLRNNLSEEDIRDLNSL